MMRTDHRMSWKFSILRLVYTDYTVNGIQYTRLLGYIGFVEHTEYRLYRVKGSTEYTNYGIVYTEDNVLS